MIRMFDVHNERKQREIGGYWRMEKLTADGSVAEVYTATVPSCWESMRGLEDFRGRCRYIKKVSTCGGNLRLIFKGVSHTADVRFDGEHIAHHYNAYTQFETVISKVDAGEHTIEVVADNTFSDKSTLHFPNDYKSYGGITRPVILEELNDAYIKYAHITPILRDGKWFARIEVEVDNISSVFENLALTVTTEGKEQTATDVFFDNDVYKTEFSFSFDDVTEWTPENPKLYTVNLKLFDGEKIIDDLNERFGFREVKTEGNRILLNGKPIYIKGFNRHEDYGTLGCAVPEGIMAEDLDIIIASGANLVRTSHYPNDERFLDMCDERGILVWEEAHARQIYTDRMKNPNFKKQAIDGIDEMIINHYNHPSIILWGVLNECDSVSEVGREAYTFHFNRIKELDSSRLTTTASNKYFKDICHDLPDVISFNYYPQWYYNGNPKEYLERLRKYVTDSCGIDKPMLISEFGGAAIYGYRSFSNVKWSEDRQAEIMDNLINIFYDIDFLSGMIIWQFADCRVDSEFPEFTARPKTQNNKGVLDIYRQPKMSYYTVCKNFSKKENYI